MVKKMIPLDTVILSDRLRLRRFSKLDIPFVFSASRYDGFCNGMRWSPPHTENELLAPFLANEQAWQSGAAYTFTIESRSTAESLGRIAIRRQEGSIWDVGFWTHPLHQRQGYMTEAATALINFAFIQLAASEIQAAHATWNVASRRVLDQAGMRFIKRDPEGFQKNGQWIEEDLLSITRQQWQQRTEPVINLKTASAEEFQAYREHALDDYTRDGRTGAWPSADAARRAFDRALPDGLATPNQHLLSILDPSVGCVGMLWMTVIERPASREVFILDLVVFPQFRRLGYATRALDQASRYARGLGLAEISLSVFEANPAARALYGKCGYLPIFTRMTKQLGSPAEESRRSAPAARNLKSESSVRGPED